MVFAPASNCGDFLVTGSHDRSISRVYRPNPTISPRPKPPCQSPRPLFSASKLPRQSRHQCPPRRTYARPLFSISSSTHAVQASLPPSLAGSQSSSQAPSHPSLCSRHPDVLHIKSLASQPPQ
nr:hypothetical protein Iba_chr11dCG1890 [Ipomoea batatas]